MSADDRLRVGIAGLGRMGSRHARNLATRVPNAHRVVACSPSAEQRAWAARELRVPWIFDGVIDEVGVSSSRDWWGPLLWLRPLAGAKYRLLALPRAIRRTGNVIPRRTDVVRI